MSGADYDRVGTQSEDIDRKGVAVRKSVGDVGGG